MAEWAAGSMVGWRLDRSRVPWMKGFTPSRSHESILDEELEAFDEFTAPYLRGLEQVAEAAAAAAEEASDTGAAQHGAAAAAGIAVPQAPLLLHVTGLNSPQRRRMRDIIARRSDCAGELTLHGTEGHLSFPEGNAVLQFAAASAGSGSASPQLLAAALREEVKRHPQVRRVGKVLTHVLWQSSLLTDSGLSAPALAVMTAAALRSAPEIPALPEGGSCSDAALLRAVLRLYGSSFDASQQMVTLKGLVPLVPCFTPAAGGLWVCHPGDAAVNIASGCRHLKRIQGMLTHCSAALARWDGPRDQGQHPAPGSKSPLASVIAFNRLAAAYAQAAPLPAPPGDPPSDAGGDCDDPPPLVDCFDTDALDAPAVAAPPRHALNEADMLEAAASSLNPHAAPFAPPARGVRVQRELRGDAKEFVPASLLCFGSPTSPHLR
eukprot:TRINITY_DN46797_c0_g1_i1.p1 TRINITY_DN46797_c0_g1~~TRINITY_DN46797_c0_g1_i1.p1  ORF type:complete len:481 (+),score=147.50 TRINITY_DN46797_c0_g1_i1:141-1445(+)